jgi:hypothetical protein
MSDIAKFLPLVYIGLAAVVGVIVWRATKFGTEKAGQALDDARGGTTNLIERFFPLTNSNALITHAVWFPDGRQHAVPGENVDKDGFFTHDFVRYRLVVDSQGRKIAQGL